MEHKEPALDAQKQHWNHTLRQRPEMFGVEPSAPARKAAAVFGEEGKRKILELGAGQGRDALFFAQLGFETFALDYSQSGLKSIERKSEALGLSHCISLLCHDVRQPLPFHDGSFDACYSHMLYCMALTTNELLSLSAEVWRVLKPGGLNIYTVRHTGDPDYGKGIHRGEDLYEVGGFVVHFFSRDKLWLLARGWADVTVDEFEEGRLPRKLFRVTQRKPGRAGA